MKREIVVDGVHNGFDQPVLQQIKEYLHLPQAVPDPEKQEILSGHTFPAKGNMPFGSNTEKKPLENWQKYMENGEYLRSIESGEEQNYSFIDGNKNNCKKKKGRVSVLAKLRQKQAEIARRSGKPVHQMAMVEDMERRRK